MEEPRIETIARGICIRDGFVLLCRGKKAGNLYFPGGHVEFGETGALALEREMMEEAGVESRAAEFLGCAEHVFDQEGSGRHAEINLVYALEIPSARPGREVKARESWIAFEWMPVAELAGSRVEPAALRKVAAGWHARRAAARDRLATSPGLLR